MKKSKFFILALVVITAGCNKTDNPINPEIKYGKNTFTTVVDGITREYIVSVPKGYDGKTAIPVVFMLHGTGGDGERFYNTSGWQQVGDSENILTIFPSSLKLCIIDEGVRKTISKWNSQPAGNWHYCDGVTPGDDVKFFGKVIDEIEAKYKVDSKRIYFVGFSNGGQMCAKLSILMSDRIAAIVESASSFSIDTTYTPLRKLPVTYQLGNADYGPDGEGPDIPLSKIDDLLSYPGLRPNVAAQTHIKSFDLDPNYTLSGDTSKVMIASYHSKDGNVNNQFNFALIKGLDHKYPNGSNHWLFGARANWEWLKTFSLP